MIIIDSRKGIKEIDKIVLGLLLTDNPSLLEWRNTISLGRTINKGYEVWSEWVKALPLSIEGPSIFQRYVALCCRWNVSPKPVPNSDVVKIMQTWVDRIIFIN